MKEILPYFGHDNNALNHPKCQALLASFGYAGYGRFWALNESVAASEQARLDLSKKVNRAGLAVRLQLSMAELEAFLLFLSDPEECGLIRYENGIVTTDRTTENLKQLLDAREAAKARKEAKKAGSANSAQSSANSGESSANFSTKESKGKIKETKEASLGSVAEFDEFAGSAETAAPETYTPSEYQTPPDDFDPQVIPHPQDDFEPTLVQQPTASLKVPANIKLSAKDLDELQSRFGTRSQEAVDKIGAIYAAKDYGYKNHWAGVKLWLADHVSPSAWLDKVTGKSGPQPRAEPMSARQAEASKPAQRLAGVPETPDERRPIEVAATDFIRSAQAARRAQVDDFEPRAEGA